MIKKSSGCIIIHETVCNKKIIIEVVFSLAIGPFSFIQI